MARRRRKVAAKKAPKQNGAPSEETQEDEVAQSGEDGGADSSMTTDQDSSINTDQDASKTEESMEVDHYEEPLTSQTDLKAEVSSNKEALSENLENSEEKVEEIEVLVEVEHRDPSETEHIDPSEVKHRDPGEVESEVVTDKSQNQEESVDIDVIVENSDSKELQQGSVLKEEENSSSCTKNGQTDPKVDIPEESSPLVESKSVSLEERIKLDTAHKPILSKDLTDEENETVKESLDLKVEKRDENTEVEIVEIKDKSEGIEVVEVKGVREETSIVDETETVPLKSNQKELIEETENSKDILGISSEKTEKSDNSDEKMEVESAVEKTGKQTEKPAQSLEGDRKGNLKTEYEKMDVDKEQGGIKNENDGMKNEDSDVENDKSVITKVEKSSGEIVGEVGNKNIPNMEEKSKASGGTSPEEIKSKEVKTKEGKGDEVEVIDVANENTKESKALPKVKPAELKKYWDAVSANTSDFTGWTYLLHYVEQKNDMEFYREAFDAFFQHFPYCYGYWKKYADMERKHSQTQKTYKVFERGVKAIPLSCDLWIHYINFVLADMLDDENREEKVREIYERAISASGMDFRSDKLWDHYLKFEKQLKNYRRVMALYDKLITIPTQLHGHHFEKMKDFLKKHHPKNTLSLDEFLDLRAEYMKKRAVTSVDDDAAEGPIDTSADLPPGVDDGPPGVDDEAPPGEEPLPLPRPGGKTEDKLALTESDDEENEAIRKQAVERREAIFNQTAGEIKKRSPFEEAIRRPYFHAKPLEKGQLRNWREYLNFEVANGSHERVVILFERCLVACALYDEFWLKYAKYMENISLDSVSDIFRRACSVHLPKKHTIHLQWATFESKRGKFDIAREVLANLEKNLPGLIFVILERINLERRLKNYSKVISMYENYIEKAKDADQKSFFSHKLATFYQKVVCDTDKASQVLFSAIDKGGKKDKIYTMLFDLEYQRIPTDEDAFLSLSRQILDDDLDPEVKLAFSRRTVEFIRDFGKDMERLYTVQEEHQKLVKSVKSSSKKRSQPETKTEAPESKKAKSDPQSAQSHQNTPSSNTSANNTSSTAHYTYPVNTQHSQHYAQQQSMAHQQYHQAQWSAYQTQYGNYQNQQAYGSNIQNPQAYSAYQNQQHQQSWRGYY